MFWWEMVDSDHKFPAPAREMDSSCERRQFTESKAIPHNCRCGVPHLNHHQTK